jgi:hypothetical protein
VTTVKEVRKLVAPLLERNPDLAVVGRLIVLKPVHHILRGVFIDATSQANQCEPRWLMMDLPFKADDIIYGVGGSLFRSKPRTLWWLDDPEISADLVFVVERDVLPKLRSIQTLQDYFEAAVPKDPVALKRMWGMQLTFAVARGDLEAARGFLANDLKGIYMRPLNEFRAGLGDRLLKNGARVSAEDRQALADYLHDCEAYTVGKLKIAHLWETTPFPIEQQGVRRRVQ